MSDQKKTKTDIKLALQDAAAAAEMAFTVTPPDEAFVDNAFKGSGLSYEFDSSTKEITIFADASSGIVCAYNFLHGWSPNRSHGYIISTYMNYDGAYSMDESGIKFMPDTLPAMIPFFHCLVDELRKVKAKFDNHYKSAKSGELLKALSKPLLRKEKIIKSKMALVQGSDGVMRLYNLIAEDLKVLTLITLDNYSQRIADYGNIFREIPKTIVNRESDGCMQINIGKLNRELTPIGLHQDEDYSEESPYEPGIKLLQFDQTSPMVDGLEELCGHLQQLKLHYGILKGCLVIQINDSLCIAVSEEWTGGQIKYQHISKQNSCSSDKNFSEAELIAMLHLLFEKVPLKVRDKWKYNNYYLDNDSNLADMLIEYGVTKPYSSRKLRSYERRNPETYLYLPQYAGFDCLRFSMSVNRLPKAIEYLNSHYDDMCKLLELANRDPNIVFENRDNGFY